jgi:PncC family amidohydrolase
VILRYSGDPEHSLAQLDAAEAEMRSRLAQVKRVVVAGDRGLDGELVDLIGARGLTMASAESCTGGRIAARITAVPGVSKVFVLGVVTYSNHAKTEVLGIDPGLIEHHGAVSAEVAAAMADGARRLAGSDLAVSVTGIAGPGGGTSQKPVGLVYLGFAVGDNPTETVHLHLAGGRAAIQSRAVVAALCGLTLRLR